MYYPIETISIGSPIEHKHIFGVGGIGLPTGSNGHFVN